MVGPPKRKDPSVLVESVQLNKRNRRMVVKVTCPLYACSWLGERLVVGGGSPPGWGQGRPLGVVDIDMEQSGTAKADNKYTYTETHVESLSNLVPFEGSHLAVTGHGPCITFRQVRPDGTHVALASYSRHASDDDQKYEPRRLALSRSGRIAVVNSDSHSIHVVAIDRDTRGWVCRPAAILQGHTKVIASLAMAPLPPPPGVTYDRKKPHPILIASVSHDCTLRLWRTGDAPSEMCDGDDWVPAVSASTGCVGVISLVQPPHFPTNDDPQKRFRLQAVRFSNNGSQLHVVMARGGGPCFLVSYAIQWKCTETNGKKSFNLSCSTLTSVELDKSDAVTVFEISPCGNYLAYGTADNGNVGVATKNGELVNLWRGHHSGPVATISVKQLSPTKLRLATTGLGDMGIKVCEVDVTQGMTPLDVLKVVTGLFIVLLSVIGFLMASGTEASLLTCLQEKLWSSYMAVPSETAFKFDGAIPARLKQFINEKHLVEMSLQSPEVLGGLVGLPLLAAVSTALTSASNFLLYVWLVLAAGLSLGDALLRLMPMGDSVMGTPGSSHFALLLRFGLMFVLDAMTRTPPPDPSFQQTVFTVSRKEPGEKLGLNITSSGEISIVLNGSPAQRAGLKVGMKIVAVNDKPTPGENVLDALRQVGDAFTVETAAMSYGSSSPVPIDTAWKSCFIVAVLQHLVGALLFVTRSKQYALLLSGHALLYEIAGTAVLLCCNVSGISSILLRLFAASVWALPAAGVINEQNASMLAYWVVPTATAASLYLSLAHLLPALVQSTKYGLFGIIIQVVFITLGVFAHPVLG